jgi:serine/threonine protein kinase
LPEKEILRLGIQLTEGLVAAHAQGVIHRDLKPGNLIITREGRLKILDFGLAVLVIPENIPDSTRTLTQATPVEGTLPYMSPEQLRGQKVDARSDVYSAGAVLYEMATGNRPFPHSQSAELIGAILHETPPPPRSFNQRVTPGLEILILKTLEKEPEQRYQSAAELQVALEDRKTDRILDIREGQRRTQPVPRPSVHDQDLPWIRERLSSEPKPIPTHREPFESVPPLPPNYIEPSAWSRLRDLLVAQADAAPVAVEGPGGIGKTVMAIALCHDDAGGFSARFRSYLWTSPSSVHAMSSPPSALIAIADIPFDA